MKKNTKTAALIATSMLLTLSMMAASKATAYETQDMPGMEPIGTVLEKKGTTTDMEPTGATLDEAIGTMLEDKEPTTDMEPIGTALVEEEPTEAEKRQLARESISDGEDEHVTIHRVSILDAQDGESAQLLEDVALSESDDTTPHVKLAALATLGTLAHYEVEAFEALRRAASESPQTPETNMRVERGLSRVLYANASRGPSAENPLKLSDIEALMHDETLDVTIRALGVWGIRDEEVLTSYVKQGCIAGADSPEQGLERFAQTPRQCGAWSLKAKDDPDRFWKVVRGQQAGVVLRVGSALNILQ